MTLACYSWLCNKETAPNVMWVLTDTIGWSTQHRAPWWRGQFTFVAVCEAARACSTYLSMIPRYSRSAIVSFVSGDSAQWGFLDSSLNTQFAFHGLRVRPALGFIILLMPRHWLRVPALCCPAQLNLAAPPWPIGTFLGRHWLTLYQFHPAAARPVRDGEGRR